MERSPAPCIVFGVQIVVWDLGGDMYNSGEYLNFEWKLILKNVLFQLILICKLTGVHVFATNRIQILKFRAINIIQLYIPVYWQFFNTFYSVCCYECDYSTLWVGFRVWTYYFRENMLLYSGKKYCFHLNFTRIINYVFVTN